MRDIKQKQNFKVRSRFYFKKRFNQELNQVTYDQQKCHARQTVYDESHFGQANKSVWWMPWH